MGETVQAPDPGALGGPARRDLSQGGEVARHVPGQQVRLVGLPEPLRRRRQLIAGRRPAAHRRPGGLLGVLGGQGGPAARRAELAGRGAVLAGVVLDLGPAGGASYTPSQTRCGRPPSWLTHPTRPRGSGRLTVRVSTPVLRSQCPAQSRTSAPDARLRQSSRSARVALPKRYLA